MGRREQETREQALQRARELVEQLHRVLRAVDKAEGKIESVELKAYNRKRRSAVQVASAAAPILVGTVIGWE